MNGTDIAQFKDAPWVEVKGAQWDKVHTILLFLCCLNYCQIYSEKKLTDVKTIKLMFTYAI